MIRAPLFACLLSVAVLSGCGSRLEVLATERLGDDAAVPDDCGDSSGLQADAPWPMRAFCSARPGRSPHVATESVGVAWSQPSPSGMFWHSPVVGVGDVVYATVPGFFLAFDGASGQQLWEGSLRSIPQSTPVIAADGSIVVRSLDAVVAIDPGTRSERWSYATDGLGSPAIAGDGTVFVGTSENRVVAVNGSDGSEVWSTPVASEKTLTCTIAGDRVYATTDDGSVYAFDRADGRQAWSSRAGDATYDIVVGVDGALYVASEDRFIRSLDPADGGLRWERELPGPAYSPSLGADGTVYVGSSAGTLHALDGTSGAELWRLNLGSNAQGTPAIDANGLLLVSTAAGLSVVDPTTQTVLREAPVGNMTFRMAAIGSDGTVFAATIEGQLVAIGG